MGKRCENCPIPFVLAVLLVKRNVFNSLTLLRDICHCGCHIDHKNYVTAYSLFV